MPVTDMVASVFGPGIVFLVIGGVMICWLYFRSRMHTDKVLQSLVEKGLPIPTELFRKTDTQDARAVYLARGAILVSVGLAAIVFFWAMTSGNFGPRQPDVLWLPFLGIFPLFAGIACIAIGFVQRPHD